MKTSILYFHALLLINIGMVGSDHRPIVAFLEDKVSRRRRKFWFDKRWIGQDGLLDSIGRG